MNQYEYYSLLEIEQTATEAEIKKAYRKKAMELHPDRHGGDKQKEAEFKKLNEAYATLSDPKKKAHYDRFGTTDGMNNGFSGFGGGFEGVDISDIFSEFFGGGFGGSGRRRQKSDIGSDIEIQLKISLQDAIQGVSRKIEFSREKSCDTCAGKGGKTEPCKNCHGSGQVRERIQTIFGIMEQQNTCPVCHGSGEAIIEKCHTCHGSGKIKETVTKTIEVPKGIEDGMSIKMRDEGNQGKNGNGDLYITFSVPSSEGGLIRRGSDLFYILPISPAEATLGIKKSITIPIIGKKEIEIKNGTEYGTEIRFRHEGMESLGTGKGKGDLIIRIEITIPKKISADQKKLYQAILQSEGSKPKKGWLEEIFGG